MNEQHNRSILRALAVLRVFVDEPELSLTAISNKVALSKGTTSRILKTLESEGFVHRNSSMLYSLGIVMVQLGAAAEKNISLISGSEPFLKQLSEATGETVSLNAIIDRKRLCVKKIDSLHTIRDFIEMNKLLPIYRGASGKAMLAFMENEEREAIIASIEEEAFDSVRLRKQLDEIRQSGYAESSNDRVNGASAIAAPIFGKDGALAGGVGLSGVAMRFTEKKRRQYIELVTKCASDISYHLGNNDAQTGE